ncbi:type II toxin-antitoxin system HicA family toxin [Pedobacter sp. L105]|uniref:type II toxin-antitoxin system HicA family toxin n=1 Tax=Pedobacter sp. L105 TaxID=1641871 RepID=UPI00131B4CEB|nr:type II toxin-antitoxin system HicA family toxin [Pedobacter sp. L105]
MRARKPKDIEKALLKKGFISNEESHHKYYILHYDGKKTDIYTYLSHSKRTEDYGTNLMQKIKQQLRFNNTRSAERFLDCPMTQNEYIEMLKQSNSI